MVKQKKNKQEQQKHNIVNPIEVRQTMPKLATTKKFFKFSPFKVYPQIDNLVEELVDKVNSNIKVWEQNHNFGFLLPESQFDLTRDTPVISYVDQEKIVDDVEPRPLSEQQKQSLYETGTFIVNSKKYSIPYKWLVHSMLYIGREHRTKVFLNILSVAFGQIYKIKANIFSSNPLSFKNTVNSLKQSLFEIADLVIGLPWKVKRDKQVPARVLEIQRQVNIRKDWDKVNKGLNFLYLNEHTLTGEKQKLDSQLAIIQINRIETQFNLRWKEIEKMIRQKLEQDVSQDQFNERLEEQKYSLLYKIESDLRPDLLEHLHFLLREQQVIRKAFRKLKTDNIKARQEIERELKSHSIKSRCIIWYREQFDVRAAQAEKQNYENTLDYLETQLETPFFKDYVLFCKNYPTLEAMARKKVTEEIPFRAYSETYRMAISKVIPNPHSPATFTLLSYATSTFETGHYFWRFSSAKSVYIAVFNQIIHGSIYNLTRGPWSLKYLFGSENFDYQESIEPSTGTKIYASVGYPPRSPLRLEIKKTYDSIKESRNQFQASPDTGFMKKSYARVFNLVYCYLFLGLFKMCLVQCMVIPIVSILINIAFVFVLVFSWLVAFFITVGQYLIGIFIFRFRVGDQNNTKMIPLPIFFNILKFIANVIKIIWIVLLIIFFHPLFSLITLIAAYVYKLTTSIYYQLIFSIIKVIARSPTSDSKIAWRIEGPGISKNFSQKINPDDIYILFLSQCEKIHLTLYEQSVTSKLNSITADNNTLVGPLISSFQAPYVNQTKAQQSINFYMNKLRQQIAQRMRIYPVLHNSVVRFTQQQLNQYTGNCIEMVQFFMESHQNCDFYQFFGIDKYQHEKEDLLVIAIWQRIFGNANVFEAFQPNAERYNVIQQERDQSQTQNVMKQINDQHQFKKSGHRKFKFSSSFKNHNAQAAPTTVRVNYAFPTTEIGTSFAPIRTLVTQIGQVNNIWVYSKDHPDSSVLVCAAIDTYANEIADLNL